MKDQGTYKGDIEINVEESQENQTPIKISMEISDTNGDIQDKNLGKIRRR